MLQPEKLLSLTQLVSLSDDQDQIKVNPKYNNYERILDFCITDTNQLYPSFHENDSQNKIQEFQDLIVVIVNQSGKLFAIHLINHHPDNDCQEHFKVYSIPWFDSDDLRPVCVTFSPEKDFLLIATVNKSLYIIATNSIVSGFVTKEKNINYREWSSSNVNRILQSQTTTNLNEEYHLKNSPTSLIWWNTHEFQTFALIGTQDGCLYCYDLVSGLMTNSLKVSNDAINKLEIFTDLSMGSSFLLITSLKTQFKLLLEQVTSGYFWGINSTNKSPVREKTPKSSNSEESLNTPKSARSTMSAAFESFKNKFSEGKKSLNRRLSPSISSIASSNDSHQGDQEESKNLINITNLIGDNANISVQNDYGSMKLSGLFSDKDLMALLNYKLEALPQSSFQLPKLSESVLLLDKLLLVVSKSSNNRSEIHIVSSYYAEQNADGYHDDSVLQTFKFSEGEEILSIINCQNYQSPPIVESTKLTSSSPYINHNSPDQNFSTSLQFLGENNNDSIEDLTSEALIEFGHKVKIRLADIKTKSKFHSFRSCIVISSQAIYLMHMDEHDPASVFLELKMREKDTRKTEFLARTFSLDSKALIELAGDLRLLEVDIPNAYLLYNQAGLQPLKVVLKFFISGLFHDLAPRLSLMCQAPNLEVTPADRVHLSNFMLMTYLHQILTRKTPIERLLYKRHFENFLITDKWFDERLSIELISRTQEWDLLGHLSQSRGLQYEMIESMVNILLDNFVKQDKTQKNHCEILTKSLKEMTSIERNNLLSCILHSDNIKSIICNPQLAKRFLEILTSTLTLLEEPGLRSVILQCGPSNPGLRNVYHRLLNNNNQSHNSDEEYSEEEIQFSLDLLNLAISSTLLLLKKQKRTSLFLDCDNYPSLLLNNKLENISYQPSKEIPLFKESFISGGTGHVLLKKNNNLLSWGVTNFGVCGHGAVSSKFISPTSIEFFSSPSMKVLAVSCGKTHSLALTNYGLYSWGSSKYGQLGLGPERLCEQRPMLVKTFANSIVTEISAGTFHSVVLTSLGQVWTFGWNVHGQLGLGNIEDEFYPRRIGGPLRNEFVIKVAAGPSHTILLTNKKQVWAFGNGMFGQLGCSMKKTTVPIKIDAFTGLNIDIISSGFYDNLAGSSDDNKIFIWGCQPVIKKILAQQKRKQRKLRQNASNNKALNENDQRNNLEKPQQQDDSQKQQSKISAATSLIKVFQKQAKQSLDTKISDTKTQVVNSTNKSDNNKLDTNHTNNNEFDDNFDPEAINAIYTDEIEGKIIDLKCGNPNLAILTDKGQVYAFRRNIDGQFGAVSKTDEKNPPKVVGFKNPTRISLKQENIKAIACGIGYTIALGESGSAFTWGNNSRVLLGKNPQHEEEGYSSKVVGMKSINKLPKSTDVPMAVEDITDGIYSNHTVTPLSEDDKRNLIQEMMNIMDLFKDFNNLENPGQEDKLLHAMLEKFHHHLDYSKVIKKCLVSDNFLAAAKLSLLRGNILQAFDFSLQLIMRKYISSQDQEEMPNKIFKSFLYYLNATNNFDADEQLIDQRHLLLERLIACWQDQKFSFLQLEKLCLKDGSGLLLQTLVLTLFKPQNEDDDLGFNSNSQGPGLDHETGPKLVDLFTPEFCLKLGDRFVREIRKEKNVPRLQQQASNLAGNWIRNNSSGATNLNTNLENQYQP